ncbi:MAG TPA: DUF6804 family protein [Terriglobales bacterium]|jgi:Family of unknown function (DUF6804)|nr:DUF6804 family protein [Terriglobales bacterium]
MLTTIMKYIAIAVLLVGAFWRMPGDLRGYSGFIISAAAVFVLVQAFILRKYVWGMAFIAVVCLFNPLQPVGFSFPTLVVLEVMSAVLFAFSLPLLRTRPRMTIASITEANPKTESL